MIRIDLSDLEAALPHAAPNEFDEDAYIELTSSALPGALADLWAMSKDRRGFIADLGEILGNFAEDPS